jgi:DNA-binding IclR family transcriptional regulator
MHMLRKKRQQTIQTTEKTLELLQIVASGHRDLNINDLSQKLKIGREEVLLLLVAMENRGMVSWDNSKKIYNPGGEVRDMINKLARCFSRTCPVQIAPVLP